MLCGQPIRLFENKKMMHRGEGEKGDLKATGVLAQVAMSENMNKCLKRFV